MRLFKQNPADTGGVFTLPSSPACLDGCPENYASLTLRAALSLQGGKTFCQKAEILLRAAAAAYLNASSGCVQYPLSAGAIVAEVNTALASCDIQTIIDEATKLDGFNNLGCRIDQQGVCANASLKSPGGDWGNAVREYVAMVLRQARLAHWL
jgi:hypothetical protein